MVPADEKSMGRFVEKYANAKEALFGKLSEVLDSYLDGKYTIDDIKSVIDAVKKESLNNVENKKLNDLLSDLASKIVESYLDGDRSVEDALVVANLLKEGNLEDLDRERVAKLITFLTFVSNSPHSIPLNAQRKILESLGFTQTVGEVVDEEEDAQSTNRNQNQNPNGGAPNPGMVLGNVVGNGGNGNNGGGPPGGGVEDETNPEHGEIPSFVVKFFQLNAVRGDLWEKEDVENWGLYDYLQAIMSYVARDMMSEAHPEYPMQAIYDEVVTKKYVIEGENQKFSLHEDILPAFPSREIRDEMEWFLNALNAIEKGASSIEDVRTIGDPDKFFGFLKNDTPQPFRWSHFFRSKIELDGQEERFTTIGANFSFGELAQSAVRYLLRRVADPNPNMSGPEHNMFAHNAQRGDITVRMRKDFSNIIQRNSPELVEAPGDSDDIKKKKKEKADVLAFMVVNFSIKFLATLVPWPISDTAVLRYDSLIPTKTYRFGASERKYLTEESQSGKLSVYDKLLIANFGRLLNNGLTALTFKARYASKDEHGEVQVKEEFVTLLELLMHQCLVVEKDAATTDANGLDERQRGLLDKFHQLNKVYLDPLPDMIKENIPANIGGYWDGNIEHANDMWGLIKKDSLPMKNLLREVSSRGVFEDFKTRVPAEELKNNLANIYKRIDYWMGDSVVKDRNGTPYKFSTIEEAKKYDPDDRFMKIRVGKRGGNQHFILMNFREAFVLNPDWASGLKGELEVSDEEIEFMEKDPERLYKEQGDQYQLLRKLITEKFVISSIRHYLQEETNKNYLSYEERMALAELLSSEFAIELLEDNFLRKFVAKRSPVWLGEAYPVVSTGIWTKAEALALISIFPEEPALYSMKAAVKDEKKKH